MIEVNSQVRVLNDDRIVEEYWGLIGTVSTIHPKVKIIKRRPPNNTPKVIGHKVVYVVEFSKKDLPAKSLGLDADEIEEV